MSPSFKGISPRPAIVVLGPGGMETATKIADLLDDAEIHGLARRLGPGPILFEDTVHHLHGLFTAGRPVIGICAAGILVRALAGSLSDKREEPPVLAVAEDGSTVVPLLGGHHGANELARQISLRLNCVPAITTAGDLRFNAALDDPPEGWILSNPEDAVHFVAEMLAGAGICFTDDDVPPFLLQLPRNNEGPLRITVTTRRETGDRGQLVYHPRQLAIGVGCERGVDPAELTKLVLDTLASARLAQEAVAGVFSLDVKSDEPAVHSAAQALDVPARFFSAEILERMTPRLATPSAAVYRAVGCHGVAEGAALAAAGEDGTLILPKKKSARATCAVALSSEPIDPDCTGHPRGKLLVVGTGPGSSDWMTAECEAALASASNWVGYSRYLDLLGQRAKGKILHAFGLGEERERVAKALDLAAQGMTTALVSSGDPGIYAMASLVFELIDSSEKPEWLRVEIEVCPGVSALQAAAARIGAPLGHDFCTVSLSDLLTDWTMIEKRIEAAAAGDFVVVFYNPVSSKRRWQLEKARTVLRRKRPASTPVVIGRNLGRDCESVRLTTLENLQPEDADMLTVIIVGSSQTRISHAIPHQKWVYTPRGYSNDEPGRIVEPKQASPLPGKQQSDLE